MQEEASSSSCSTPDTDHRHRPDRHGRGTTCCTSTKEISTAVWIEAEGMLPMGQQEFHNGAGLAQASGHSGVSPRPPLDNFDSSPRTDRTLHSPASQQQGAALPHRVLLCLCLLLWAPAVRAVPEQTCDLLIDDGQHQQPDSPGHNMFFTSHRFLKDRADAGVQLARKLGQYRGMRDDAVVLGLPRGGVVIGYYVARELHLPLDIIVSRKIGCPGHEEYAVGALAQDGSVELDQSTLRMLSLSEADLKPTIDKERKEAQRRLRAYRGNRPPLDLTDKVAILVDDGIATGSTAKAALRMLGRSNVRKVVLAVPVMPADRVNAFSRLVDELIYVDAPSDFHAVGQFYQRFDQTEDEEVLDLMRRNAEECDQWRAQEGKRRPIAEQGQRTYRQAVNQ